MLNRKSVCLAAILGYAVLAGVGSASAQETKTTSKPAAQSESTGEAAKWVQPADEAYHLDLSINEIEDGKKINSRQYSMDLTTAKPVEIKIGARVPVESKEGEFQYMDIGTSIFAQVREVRDQRILVVDADVSSFAAPDGSQERHDSRPIVRQLKMGGSVLLPLTKTIVMGSADDPNSKRQFQLEVTVTKLR